MKQIFFLLLGIWLLLPARAAETNSLTNLTLQQAEQIALKNHPQIAAANYRALAAQEAVKETRAGFFPRANLYADAVGANSEDARVLAGGINNPSIYSRAAGGLALNQLLTDFGRTKNLTASSQFNAQAENQNANATRGQILLQVNIDYFSALEAQAVLHVAQQTVDTRQLLLDQVSVLASNKLKSELDVSFASVALQEGRLLFQRAQNNVDDAMTSLSTSLGYREPQAYQLAESLPPILADTNDISRLVQSALAQRPELASLRDSYDASTRLARAQRDARLPTVEAVGLAGGAPWRDSHLPEDYAVGGVQLSLPLFAGGFFTARQHEAELKAQSDSELLRSLEDNVVRDVHLAWLNVNNAVEQLTTTEELVRGAAEAFDLANARYKIGSSSIVELSQAQLALTSAQIEETNARYNLFIQQANLAFQVGSLR
jgi:outer membrane protein